MEANVFIAKLKADGSKTDVTDLDQVIKDYKEILTKLATKDRGPFSLNVLCVLCRNLEKVPSWKSIIDNKTLVSLSMDCTRETRTLNPADQVKALACIYHIHKHAVKQITAIPPELILKLSYMPFEMDTLLTEYAKTYWNILADRISYIEKLKTKRMNVVKLLPKFTEDTLKVIKIYNTVQFCSTILTFLVKKLHFLFSDLDAKELNITFQKIFEEMQSKTDLRWFKKLPDRETFDIYMKLNDCLYVIAENSSKNNFEGSVLNTVVQTCISFVGHQQDLLHCFQTIYLNGFCTILNERQNLTYVETLLSNFVTSCETTEKLGYTKAVNATYPYINQYLRLYIEYQSTTNQKNWQKLFPEQIQIACLKLMQFLLKKLKTCDQLLKCENCLVKSGLHDALRLSFLVKNFITIPLQDKLSITKTLPIYFSIILHQYEILNELCKMGCVNYEKCYRKLQSDIHNTAILLNKSQNFEFSIKLFELYLNNEILHFKMESDLKNISRALYNVSICELDCKQFDNALIDAYLSLVFAYPEGLTTEKYMSLVMDIKAKVLKSKDDLDDQANPDIDDLQMTTVLDACAMAIEGKRYGNLKPFFCNLKFSELLQHEFQMYVKLWPSIVPIAGVWRTLYDLTQHDVPWLNVTDDSITKTLHQIILETPSSVRTIHNSHFSDIITEMIQTLGQKTLDDIEMKLVYATMLFMKAEFDLVEAGVKYGWKPAEPTVDPDQFEVVRTLAQEHEATKQAVIAVEIWNDIVKDIHKVPLSPTLELCLQTAQVFVPQLLHLFRVPLGLQLAFGCCEVAKYIQNKTSYITNAATIVYYANKQTDKISQIIATASAYCGELLNSGESVEAALVFLGNCAIYYKKIGSISTAAKLIQGLQAKILHYYEKFPEINLDLAVGKLLEAEVTICDEVVHSPSKLSGVIGVHRHYLAVGNSETKWSSRRLRALQIKLHISTLGISSCRFTRRLLLWRRARSGAGATLHAASATGQAVLAACVTDPARTPANTVYIDNRLKYVLGIQPSCDQPAAPILETKSHEPFTPRQELETMLENMTFKKTQISPSIPCIDSVPGFKCPDFLKHDMGCKCYACQNHYSLILACQTAFLEAAMYFRAKEFDIARNYFEGTLLCLKLAESKLKSLKNMKILEDFLLDVVEKVFNDEFRQVQIETLIEIAFFELSQANHKTADEHIVRINEILQENENIDPYLKNEILNLMITSARLRKLTKSQVSDFNLDVEFENLKLSPTKTVEAPKTPESKAEKPPKLTKIKAKDEEVPNTKRRVIKLNLDDNPDEKDATNTKKRTSKRTEFKIPVPVTAKAVLESVTPVPTPRSRRKPDILVTQPSKDETNASIFEFATPKPKNADKTDFFTPMDTPSEQFFTPMSSIKTYGKKTLRHGIVKNLESEFSTPKSEVKNSDKNQDIPKSTTKSTTENDKTKDKENLKGNTDMNKAKNVETGSVKSLKDKRSLKRATSPGKLKKNDKKTTRSTRLRQPVKFSLDDDDNDK